MADRFPWFPLYAADWRLSRAVRAMTPEQRGGYIELLTVAWDDGIEEPSLPEDDATLAKMSDLGARWAKVGAPIRACFVARDGRLYNEKLSHIWEVQRARYAIKSEAGRLGGIAKAKAKASIATPVPDVRQHSARRFAGQTQTSDRTNSSSGPTALSALTDGALAAAKTAHRA